MSTRTYRKHDEFAVHFRCDLCGKIQPVRIITKDEMLDIMTSTTKFLGEHVCQACIEVASAAYLLEQREETGVRRGLHD